ncbi:class II aldolase/adducin family protein [Alteribacillus iranensis]|uniref:Ribulose-5-phosphate 4-epimerase/Fuculose-1-phosphate aldolase n=1 Tax=Alteribacillus iranensis TaxID=930128 RepID=A0A1I2B376_9BACI|nr:class II aldolase/adducin family protein [Alteribacillus iranensis]SFE50546.1 Ribulose-5-phosphate 4-epimerase/Fuculose-1-phosphate aldolase [Alteribacillus iranensis]
MSDLIDHQQFNNASRTVEEERAHRKKMLAASFRLFARFGFDMGVAGHITARDPELTDHFWVNPFAKDFSQIKVSDLVLVNHRGKVVEGDQPINKAAFAIHSQIHEARPDAVAAAHSHSTYGKAWSALGRLLDPISQDACAFYEDHSLFNDYTGVVYETEEGQRIANALGDNKAVILQNHGLLTVGNSVESAAWWFISMERACQAQMLAEQVGKPIAIEEENAKKTWEQVGFPQAGVINFEPLYERIVKEEPDFID